jgi:hypothetical protein
VEGVDSVGAITTLPILMQILLIMVIIVVEVTVEAHPGMVAVVKDLIHLVVEVDFIQTAGVVMLVVEPVL